MSYILIIIGIVLFYFGKKTKIANGAPIKELANKSVSEGMMIGLKGYVKIMMMISGVGFMFLGIIFWLLF